MRLDHLTYSTLRWLAAAAAAAAFVVTLSVQTIRGDSVASPAAAAGDVATAISSDSTPATVPTGGGKLVAVSIPGLRAPVHKARRQRAAAAPTVAPAELVAAPAVTPVPSAAPVPTAAAPAPAPAPAPVAPRAAPPAKAPPPAPKPPAHGPGFDSSG